MVAENLVQVQKNIEESCKKVNRDPGEVTLIAVRRLMLQVHAFSEKIKYRRSWINMIRCRQMFSGI